MSRPNKTVGTELFAMTALTHATTLNVQKSAEIDTSTMIAGIIYLHHGFNEAAADNASGQRWVIQISPATTGNRLWVPYQTVNITYTGTTASEVFGSTEPAAEVLITTIASTTGFSHGGDVFIRNATFTNSEWATVAEFVANTSITLVDGLTNAQTITTSILFPDAQHNAIPMDFSGINRLRVLYYNNFATASNTVIEASLTTTDAYTPIVFD